MPTIDQLAPATAASDTDLLVAEQSGITRSVTRAQLVSGLQPQLVLPQGSVLGRSSSGTGGVETVQVGANLSLNAGTLAALAAPFVIAALPAGTVPAPADLVALSQQGTSTAVPFSEFVAGITAVPGFDISGATIVPSGTAAPQVLASWASTVVTAAGGTIACAGIEASGAVTVAGPLLAATIGSSGSVVAASATIIGPLTAEAGVTVAGGTLALPSYRVAALPSATPGALAYASDGRKNGEPPGAGSGVLVWGTGGGQWISAASGTVVQA
ncbi:MAG TPA: hypothetical protein VFA03_06445 [Acetobacteraceae bacterium]|nr:hypothetical protein [Acetobacteraceae bacterium]